MTLIWPTIGSTLLVPFWKQDCKNLRKIIYIKHYQCQCNCFNVKLFQYSWTVSMFDVSMLNIQYLKQASNICYLRWAADGFSQIFITGLTMNIIEEITSPQNCVTTHCFFSLDIFPFFSVISQVWPNLEVYCKIYSSKLCF